MRRYIVVVIVLSVISVAVNLQGCVKVTLEKPKEKAIRVDKLRCISLPFREANCEDALKELNVLIATNPNDLWARSERADIRHIIARENMRQAMESAKNDPKKAEDAWCNFLTAWKDVYKDIEYFYIVEANTEDAQPWVQYRTKRILGDFFYLNGNRLYKMTTQTGVSEDGTQVKSEGKNQDRQYRFLAGELYHMAVSQHAKNYVAAEGEYDKTPSFSMRVMLDEICESWYATYTAYNNYRSVDLGDSIEEVILCHSIKEHEDKIYLKWNVGTLLPSRYKEISDIFYMVRKTSWKKANKSNKRQDWLEVVDKSTNELTAIIMSEFMKFFSDKEGCNDITSSLSTNAHFQRRLDDLILDTKRLKEAEKEKKDK